ncbi:helix-turn-helix domain-containing protein [Chryseobacterium arthrosphaerae]|uniref:helix-turn-helix domain-containing protein n=1 Tax=Chryseobacterium arthrosphaerae TaxID=651561 RepID=UPI001E2A5BB8|nr:helix-turn-helix domain-containing protein [Chryseobacterium arthrosphaerae]UEQ78365.1 helix-turn-helix domain-containing protein [Chryseobacterium arthrosphaerae]
MSKLKTLREQKNFTQEELSERSKISVRTIQRIESGTEPKGHTLRALAQTLEIEESLLLQQETIISPENNGIKAETAEESETISYSRIKMINLSSLLFVVAPPLNILAPFLLMFLMKQRNSLTKQIISLQMFWTAMAPIVFMIGIFLKLGKEFTLILMILIALSNVFMILRNAAEIDRKNKLYFKLKFSML